MGAIFKRVVSEKFSKEIRFEQRLNKLKEKAKQVSKNSIPGRRSSKCKRP